jgi:serine/threonine protein kinase
MTQTPGTPAFMPPEVMAANPMYDTSVDVFSYGIMMIHMFSGQWPEPQVGPSRTKKGKIFPVSEVERREMFLKAIGKDRLMDLIHRCINNDPQSRPHTKEITRRVGGVALQFPATFANKLEMLRRLKAVEEKNSDLVEERKRIHTARLEFLGQLEATKEEKRALAEERENIRAERLEILGQLEAVKEEKRALAEEGERIHTALMEKIDTTIVEKDATISAMSEQLTKARQILATERQVSTLTHKLQVQRGL